jgi:hypothetical protein
LKQIKIVAKRERAASVLNVPKAGFEQHERDQTALKIHDRRKSSVLRDIRAMSLSLQAPVPTKQNKTAPAPSAASAPALVHVPTPLVSVPSVPPPTVAGMLGAAKKSFRFGSPTNKASSSPAPAINATQFSQQIIKKSEDVPLKHKLITQIMKREKASFEKNFLQPPSEKNLKSSSLSPGRVSPSGSFFGSLFNHSRVKKIIPNELVCSSPGSPSSPETPNNNNNNSSEDKKTEEISPKRKTVFKPIPEDKEKYEKEKEKNAHLKSAMHDFEKKIHSIFLFGKPIFFFR